MTKKVLSKSSFCMALVMAGVVAGIAMGINDTAFADTTDMSTPHSDSVSAAATDTLITTKVKSQFVGQAQLKKSEISVTTTNGVVTLTGSASSHDAKSAAEKMAASVDGVKSVDNQLQTPASAMGNKVDKAAAKTERVASDSWITTKVKSEIVADSVSKGFHVSVTTRHGVVALSGTLANQDAVDHVKDIAGKVKGVKSVDTSMLKVAAS